MSPGRVSTLNFEQFYNIVGGKQRGSDKIHHGVNPATRQELWDVPIASDRDLNDAVVAARKAFPGWRDTPIEERKELLGKLVEIFEAHSDNFIELLCRESGKPVCDVNLHFGLPELMAKQRKSAAFEVGMIAGLFGHHIGLDMPSDRLEDDEKTVYTEYTPLGICAGKTNTLTVLA